MNQLKALTVCCLIIFLASPAALAADRGGYVSGRLGACILNDATLSEPGFPYTINTEYDMGLGIGGAIGYDFGIWRVEGEVAYRINDVDSFTALGIGLQGSGDIDTLSTMANVYFDFENQTAITPFIGAGMGFAQVSANDWSVAGIRIGSEDDSVFAYQFFIGLGISVTERLMLDLVYNYFATSDPEFGITEAEYDSHNISFGARFNF